MKAAPPEPKTHVKPSLVKKSKLKLSFMEGVKKAAALKKLADKPDSGAPAGTAAGSAVKVGSAAGSAAPAGTGADGTVKIGAQVFVCSDRSAHSCGREGTARQILGGTVTMETTTLQILQAPLADVRPAGGYKAVQPGRAGAQCSMVWRYCPSGAKSIGRCL